MQHVWRASSLPLSSSGEYLLTGSSHGCLRIHPLPKPYSLASLQDYWAINMHDNLYGAVTHIAVTSDDQYVLSAGADGNVFVYKAALPTAKQRQPPTVETVVSMFSSQGHPMWLLYCSQG